MKLPSSPSNMMPLYCSGSHKLTKVIQPFLHACTSTFIYRRNLMDREILRFVRFSTRGSRHGAIKFAALIASTNKRYYV